MYVLVTRPLYIEATGLSAKKLGLKHIKQGKLGRFFSSLRYENLTHPNPFLLISGVVYGLLPGVPCAGPRMSQNRSSTRARECYFFALGALASHRRRYSRPRLQRLLLNATGADPRAELKSGARRASCPRAAGASRAGFWSGPPTWRTAEAAAKPGPDECSASHGPGKRWSEQIR